MTAFILRPRPLGAWVTSKLRWLRNPRGRNQSSCQSTWIKRPFAGLFDSVFPGWELWADPEYLQSWRDLRRREFLLWFFVLSYVPGILLIIIIINAFDHGALEHLGVYFSVAWLAGFVGASLYRQNFRCPRCHHFFFRRFRFVNARNCVNCDLACWALGPASR